METTKKLRESKETYVGSFMLPDRRWYYGTFSKGKPNGLGALVGHDDKIQIGYFEDGVLCGYGRSINLKGVVMDCYFIDSTLNKEVIIYSPSRNDWILSKFSDNILEEQKGEGNGFPKRTKKDHFERYFTRAANLSFKIDMSNEIFCFEIDQESIFYLINGEPCPDTCQNNLSYHHKEEEHVIFDSRKDIEELRNQDQSNKFYKINSTLGEQKGGDILASPSAKDWNSRRSSGQTDQDFIQRLIFTNSPPKTEGSKRNSFEKSWVVPSESSNEETKLNNKKKEDTRANQNDRNIIDPNRKLKNEEESNSNKNSTRPMQNKLSMIGEIDESEDIESPKFVFSLTEEKEDQQSEAELISQDQRILPESIFSFNINKVEERDLISEQEATPIPSPPALPSEPPFKASKYPYPSRELDNYDMKILQRASDWDKDKTLNSKNRLERTASPHKISKFKSKTPQETKNNILKNYINDYLSAFVDQKKIQKLLSEANIQQRDDFSIGAYKYS